MSGLVANTMKRAVYVFLSIFLSQSISSKAQDFSISMPENFSQEIKQDFIILLQQSTRKDWKTTSASEVSNGIVLKIMQHPDFKTKESFRLQTDGNKVLTISSSSNEGLVFGFYKHLRSLGFKFYLPGELYTIIPTLNNPFGVKANFIDQPFLQVRDFFGTGGFGSGNSDGDRTVEKDWNLWKIRNGFGSAYQLAGHRGENFILENKEKLKQNPAWLAAPLTNTDHTDQSIKLNYLNRAALNFYTDWTISPFTRKEYKLPFPAFTELLSIEPSDGGGFLNDLPANAGKKLPSISDQVYGAANLAAEKLDKLFPKYPNLGVNLYAYSSHAEPPSFPLHPRVFVQIIPYQFQNFAFGPSFVKLWAAKAKRFSLYDYLKYTDSQYDLPGGITIEETMKRLVHSVQNGSEGTLYESSYSKFSTGIPLWIIGRYMADGNKDWQKNMNLLLTDLFPSSKEPVKEMFSLFYNNPSFSADHLGNAIAFLQNAMELKTENKERMRLIELQHYLYFIHLVFQSRDTTRGSLDQRLLPLAQYAWQLYETKIVHSYRIMQLASYSFLNSVKTEKNYSLYQQLHVDWFPETPKQKTAWGKISQDISLSQSKKNFELLRTTYKASALPAQYSFAEILKELPKKYGASKKLVIGGNSNARGYFGMYSDKPTEVTIKYSLVGVAPKVTVSTIDKSYLSPSAVVLDKRDGNFSFKLPAGETSIFLNSTSGTIYRMEITTSDGIFFFDGAPRGIMAFYKKFSDPFESYTYEPDYYPSYIFFPKGAATISYSVQVNALSLTSPSGTKPTSKIIQISNDFEVRQFRINELETGKIWKATVSGNFNYSMLNIPNRYLLLQEK